MNRFMKIAMVALVAIPMGGCASVWQRNAANGGFWGTYNGDWIITKYSGGEIVDVWKLENTLVVSETGSDGWLFTDKDGNPVHIGGDMKSKRFNNRNAQEWDAIVEYHKDTDIGLTYFDKTKAKNKG